VIPFRLQQAVALSLTGNPARKYRFGAVGVRCDGAVVACVNGGTKGARTPSMHAEARLSRKLDRGSYVYVARTLRDGTPALAKPCPGCMLFLLAKSVKRVTYTISPNEWGVIDL